MLFLFFFFFFFAMWIHQILMIEIDNLSQSDYSYFMFGWYPFSFFFFFLWVTITRSGCLAEIIKSVYISKSYKSTCISFSWTDFGLSINHLFVWSNLIFLHSSTWITLPTQSSQSLYSFCANLQHSLIMWLIISSLLPHHLFLLW